MFVDEHRIESVFISYEIKPSKPYVPSRKILWMLLGINGYGRNIIALSKSKEELMVLADLHNIKYKTIDD